MGTSCGQVKRCDRKIVFKALGYLAILQPKPTIEAKSYFRPSYWETTTFLRPADLIIVGAGLTGLQAALGFKQAKPDREILVIERSPVPRGASTRNAGFACFGGPTELLADLDAYGEASMVETVRERFAGIRALKANFSGRNIDWEDNGGCEVIDDPETEAMVRERLPALNRLLAEVTGLKETWLETTPLNGFYTLGNPLEGQLHPGKLVELLLADCRKAGVRFLFGTEVTNVRGNEVEVGDLGTIPAGQVLLTVNAFARQLLPEEFGELIRPVRNQVLLSRPLKNMTLRGCYHYHEGYVYFRNVGPDRILIGGARHLAGPRSETDAFGQNRQIVRQLVDRLGRWLPQYQLRLEDFPFTWSGIIAQGPGKSPILQRTDSGVLVAGRLAGMGVALSAALAERAVGDLTTMTT